MKRLARTVLVIFGLTGDLSRRKLLPALFRLAKGGHLPEGFRILGVSRKGTTVDDIVTLMRASLYSEIGPDGGDGEGERALRRIASMLSILDMNISEEGEYGLLARELDRAEDEAGYPINRLFYLAIPAKLFPKVMSRLGKADINRHEKGVRECRFLIEKPFGDSLDSARELIEGLERDFDESQIFRIDHYLAKETAQNILAFRFGNPLFSRAWNRHHVKAIMISANERIGIEGRAAFYEHMGAMRDLVQSHLLQVLALVTMRKPSEMTSEAIHAAKEELLSRLMPPEEGRMREETIRGQYRSYRDEVGNAQSLTETYAAARFTIDLDEWKGVPILVRTGKMLTEKITEVNVVFGAEEGSARGASDESNILTIRLQPNEGIAVDLRIKKPGFDDGYEEVQLDYCYQDSDSSLPEAYERVLIDAMRGDQTLFASDAEVLSCWKATMPILDAWKEEGFPLHVYDNGSNGPDAADSLARESGVSWLTESHVVCPIRPRPRPSRRD
jgi:glucose-6-phosphate 1-dehydrogenase